MEKNEFPSIVSCKAGQAVFVSLVMRKMADRSRKLRAAV